MCVIRRLYDVSTSAVLLEGEKDFVGVCNSAESLQSLIDTIHGYCSRWRLRANVSKSAVMVFSKTSVSGEWKWGEQGFKLCISES